MSGLRIVVALSILGAAGAAWADGLPTLDVESSPPAQALRMDVGLFSPVGELGLTYSVDVASHVELEAGVGAGFAGVQLELMPRVTFGDDGHGLRFAPGAGITVAPSETVENVVNEQDAGVLVQQTVVAPWADFEPAAVELRWHGLSFSGGLGATMALFHSCSTGLGINLDGPRVCTDTYGGILPTARFGVGAAF